MHTRANPNVYRHQAVSSQRQIVTEQCWVDVKFSIKARVVLGGLRVPWDARLLDRSKIFWPKMEIYAEFALHLQWICRLILGRWELWKITGWNVFWWTDVSSISFIAQRSPPFRILRGKITQNLFVSESLLTQPTLTSLCWKQQFSSILNCD